MYWPYSNVFGSEFGTVFTVLKEVMLTLSGVAVSEDISAEMSLRSPRKLFIFIIIKNIFRIKVSQKH